MGDFRRATGIAKMIFFLVLILTLITGSLVWFDFLGILNVRSRIQPVLSFLRISPEPTEDAPYSRLLLDSDRLNKERQALEVGRRELANAEEKLAEREADVQQKEDNIAQRESSLDERQNSLSKAINQYDNKIANLKQSARYMMSMPPEDAVAIMDEYDVKDVVDLLRTSEQLSQEAGEQSLVAYWLSLISDRARAAEIQRLLVEKPGPDLDN